MGKKRAKATTKLKVKRTKVAPTAAVTGAGFWQDFGKSFVQSFEKVTKVSIETAKDLSTSSLV